MTLKYLLSIFALKALQKGQAPYITFTLYNVGFLVSHFGEGGQKMKDPNKCLCGTEVKRVNMAGTDIYFCNCGGSCFCNTVSNEPGKCKCGMNLKKVN